MLKAKESNGEILVEDTDGGVWTPNAETQAEIQSSDDRKATAKEICKSSPMRGTWAQ